MKKVRCFLAVIALVATLGGFSLQGMGTGMLANATASQHTSSISSTSSAKTVALKIYGPCPTGGDMDC
ncbi:MAG: hypothetical protein ACYDER_17420 [Ktedonobacteraceae bacterium]